MKSLLKTCLALSLIMLVLIVVTSTFDYWPYDIQPRAFVPLRWIVSTFVTAPFGESGTTAWLLTAFASGLLLLMGKMVGNAREMRASRRKAMALGVAGSEATGTRKRRIVAHSSAPITNDDIAGLFGLDREIEPRQAWRLDEASPSQATTSWLGGSPNVPPDFRWPTTDSGRPMLFLAQIDLTAVSFSGFPTSGAILFFVGVPDDNGWPYEARILPEDALAAAAPSQVPSKVVTPSEVGWSQNIGPTLQQTLVRLEPYEDQNSEEPVSKLFGVEVQDPFGFHYPDGFRNLLFIEHHERFGTTSEHWQGMSIACPDEDLRQGNLNTGQIFGCHNG